MLGMNTRMPNTPIGTIFHTPTADLFAENPNTIVWFAGADVREVDEIREKTEEEQQMIDDILDLAATLYPRFPRASLLITTRTLPAYPVNSWAATTTAGRGGASFIRTTHSALFSILPDDTDAPSLLRHFHLVQPYNHTHEAEDGRTMMVLHLASVPGRSMDMWSLADIVRDLRRGWKKHMIRVGENGSQRVWVNFSDGRQVKAVNSYNDMEARPFEDRTPDL